MKMSNTVKWREKIAMTNHETFRFWRYRSSMSTRYIAKSMSIELFRTDICLGTNGDSVGMRMKKRDSEAESSGNAELRTDGSMNSAVAPDRLPMKFSTNSHDN
jgi:hypothetical protein